MTCLQFRPTFCNRSDKHTHTHTDKSLDIWMAGDAQLVETNLQFGLPMVRLFKPFSSSSSPDQTFTRIFFQFSRPDLYQNILLILQTRPLPEYSSSSLQTRPLPEYSSSSLDQTFTRIFFQFSRPDLYQNILLVLQTRTLPEYSTSSLSIYLSI